MMKNSVQKAFLILILAFSVPACRAQNNSIDRLPAVAGQFYPADKNELTADLTRFFSNAAPSKHLNNVLERLFQPLN